MTVKHQQTETTLADLAPNKAESMIRGALSTLADEYIKKVSIIKIGLVLIYSSKALFISGGLMRINRSINGGIASVFIPQVIINDLNTDPEALALLALTIALFSLLISGTFFKSGVSILSGSIPSLTKQAGYNNLYQLLIGILNIILFFLMISPFITQMGHIGLITALISVLFDGYILLSLDKSEKLFSVGKNLKERADNFKMTETAYKELRHTGVYTEYINGRNIKITVNYSNVLIDRTDIEI